MQRRVVVQGELPGYLEVIFELPVMCEVADNPFIGKLTPINSSAFDGGVIMVEAGCGVTITLCFRLMTLENDPESRSSLRD
jgi:hypothetical protein